MNRFVASVGIVALFASVASAKNFFVVPPGTPGVPDNPDYESWETAGTSIHEAWALSCGPGDSRKATRDTIYVKSGLYLLTEGIKITDNFATIRSSKGPDAQEEIDPEGTVLKRADGAGSFRIITREGGSQSRNFVLKGFTVTGGYTTGQGGGILIDGPGSSGAQYGETGVYDCIVSNNVSMNYGGGICARGNLIVSNCLVACNMVTNKMEKGVASGLACGALAIRVYNNGGAQYTRSKPDFNGGARVFDCVISNNLVRSNAPYGSGLHCGNMGAWIQGCTVIDNQIEPLIGGNLTYPSAVWCSHLSVLNGCKVIGNKVLNETDAVVGVYAGLGTVMSNCVIRANKGAGSCVLLQAGIGEVAKVMRTNAVELVNCTVSDNACKDGVDVGARAIVRNTLITGTTGNYGGIYISGAEFQVDNCTIAENAVGVRSPGNVTEAIRNCIIYGNDREIWQATLVSPHTGLHYTNCLCSANAIYKIDVKDPLNPGCVLADPKFTDAANGDYSIVRKSPCRDTGFPCAWQTNFVDLAGNPRVFGKAVDIGAYENQEPNPGLMLLLR